MKLLSLDLGVTTGYAVMTGSGGILDYGDLNKESLEDTLDTLDVMHKPTDVCVEKPILFIRGPLGDSLMEVVRICDLVFPEAINVSPSQWKQTPFRSEPCPRGSSKHAKDAIRMGLWFLNSLKVS